MKRSRKVPELSGRPPKAAAAEEPRHYFKEMRLQQLRSFCEVARFGSFAGAAKALHVSRPAVWQQIRSLERELDASLVVRQGRKAELTQDGLALLDIVSPVIAGFDSVKVAFLDQRNQLVRRLVVTTTSRLLTEELNGPVREFARRFPQVQLTLMDRPSIEGLAMIERGEADLAILGQPDEQIAHPRMQYERLFSYPFALVCPKDHELANRAKVTLPDIVRYPLVLVAEGSLARIRIDRVLQAHGLLEKRTVALDTTNGALLIRYVELGLGIALIPLSPKHSAWQKLHVRSMERWFGEESIYVVRRSGTVELSHSVAFREIVSAALVGHNPNGQAEES